jgi:hypothetical protein
MPMRQVPTTSRSILLNGVLAAAVVALASGLLSVAPCRTVEAAAPVGAGAQEQPVAPGAEPERSSAAPSFCRHPSPPPGEALARGHAAQRVVDSRPAPLASLFLGEGGVPGISFSSRPALRGRLHSSARPALHVLFCTWLT